MRHIFVSHIFQLHILSLLKIRRSFEFYLKLLGKEYEKAKYRLYGLHAWTQKYINKCRKSSTGDSTPSTIRGTSTPRYKPRRNRRQPAINSFCNIQGKFQLSIFTIWDVEIENHSNTYKGKKNLMYDPFNFLCNHRCLLKSVSFVPLRL